jgi:hypothetical protein
MLLSAFRKDVATLKALTVGWQAMGQAVEGQRACGGCCATEATAHSAPSTICAARPPSGLCRQVHGAYMPGWQFPMNDGGSMGSATDGDEDAVTALICALLHGCNQRVAASAVRGGRGSPPRISHRGSPTACRVAETR